VRERFAAIDRELAQYGAGLDALPQIVVLNKIDLLPEPPRFESTTSASCACTRSLRDGRGIERLSARSSSSAPPSRRPVARADALVDFLVYRPRRGASARTASSAPTAASASRDAAGDAELEERCARRGAHGRRVRGRRGDVRARMSCTGCSAARSIRRTTVTSRSRETAKRSFDIDPLRVHVSANPPHKRVDVDVETSLAPARLAFPGRRRSSATTTRTRSTP
jgi:hypothetical protein